MKLRICLLLLVVICVALVALRLAVASQSVNIVASRSTAVNAVNALGIDLLRQTAPSSSNALLSPYSVQLVMAMTCAGADGQTRDEMVRTLHYPQDENQLNRSFAELTTNVNGILTRNLARAQLDFETRTNLLISSMRGARSGNFLAGEENKRFDEYLAELRRSFTNSQLSLTIVNRLYGQGGYHFRPAYLKMLADNWQAPLETVDFEYNASGVTTQINSWVEDQTHGRIRDLIPRGALDQYSRLVVVNAIYLKAPWLHNFSVERTQPGPFHLSDGTVIQVPIMSQSHEENFLLGYARRSGSFGFLGHRYTVIAIPYHCPELQFVILMPDRNNDLPALEAVLTPELLTTCTNLPGREMDLSFPKFKVEAPTLSLIPALQSLGMKRAFEDTNADFGRTADMSREKRLYLTGVYHKTFLQLDEAGTEASAGMGSARGTYGADTNVPVQVQIDRPFLFMIQHQPTGACLFLGRVTDPR
jgi:serpin B